MTDKSSEHPISPYTEQFIAEHPEVPVMHVPRIGEHPKLDAPKHDPQLAYCPCDSCMAPTAAPLEAREQSNPTLPDVESALRWIRASDDFDVRNLRGAIAAQRVEGSDCFDLRCTAKVLAHYSSHVNAELLEKLAKFEANPSRGVACFICGATMWLRDAYMEEGGKPFHPMCKVAKRAEAAEARNSVLENRNAELNMLAYGWMEAHDQLAAGNPYKFPEPADLPEAYKLLKSSESQLSTLREALRKLNVVIERLES